MTIEELMMLMGGNNPALPPIPQAPGGPIPLIAPGQTGPTPNFTLPPDAAPQAPLPGRDVNFINQYAGQAPTPPPPTSKLGRIFNAIGGFGAGIQGRGGEYLAQLREPQRRFERQTEQYQGRRTEAIQLDERRRERQQEMQTRAAERASDREFDAWVRRTGVQDQMAIEQLRQAHELEKEAKRQRFETERELEREQRRKEDDARTWAGRLGSGPGAAAPEVAKELGRYYANLKDTLSPRAAKWLNGQARRAELLARPAVGGGASSASRRETQDLQRRTSQAAAGIAGMEKLARQAMESPEEKRGPILGQMRAMAQTLAVQFPELLEVGEHNGWPFARLRLRGSQAPAQQQQPQADPLGVLK